MGGGTAGSRGAALELAFGVVALTSGACEAARAGAGVGGDPNLAGRMPAATRASDGLAWTRSAADGGGALKTGAASFCAPWITTGGVALATTGTAGRASGALEADCPRASVSDLGTGPPVGASTCGTASRAGGGIAASTISWTELPTSSTVASSGGGPASAGTGGLPETASTAGGAAVGGRSTLSETSGGGPPTALAGPVKTASAAAVVPAQTARRVSRRRIERASTALQVSLQTGVRKRRTLIHPIE